MEAVFSKRKDTKRVNAPAGSSAIFTVAGILSKAAAVAFTPFFTRLLTSAEYGAYSLFHSYLSVLVVIGTLELGGNAALRAFQKFRGREYAVILTACMLLIPSSLAVMGAFYAINAALGRVALFGGAYAMLLSSVISTGVINLFVARARFLYKPSLAILLSVLQSVITPVLSISLISLKAMKKFAHVAVKIGTATTVSAVIALTMLFALFCRVRRELPRGGRERAELFKSCASALLKLSAPLLPYYLCVMAISQADKLTVARYLGAETLGGYSVAYSAGIAPSCISSGILCALSPWIMRKTRANEFQKIRSTVTSVIFILCAMTVCFLALAPEIFSLLAPREYHSEAVVMYIISLAPIPLFLINLSSSVICAYEKTLPTLIAGIIAAVPAVAASYLLVPRLGVAFAAAVVLSAYLALAALQIFNVRRLSGELILHGTKSIRALLLAVTLAAATFAFAESIAARLALASLAAASLIYMRNDALALLSDR